MSKTPFLPLFFGDFLASTYTWTGEEQALYVLLLGYQWVSGPLPADVKKLARSVRYDERNFRKLWPTVRSKFITIEAGLVNERLEQHRDKANSLADKNRASGRKGAESRWQKNGERHESANSKNMANAIAAPSPRHDSANGVTHSNPSHPIPSHINPKSQKARKRATRAPEGFEPDLEFARREIPGIDADAEAARFRDFEFAKPRSDWSAAWRNWIRTCRDSGRYAKAAAAGGIQWQ